MFQTPTTTARSRVARPPTLTARTLAMVVGKIGGSGMATADAIRRSLAFMRAHDARIMVCSGSGRAPGYPQKDTDTLIAGARDILRGESGQEKFARVQARVHSIESDLGIDHRVSDGFLPMVEERCAQARQQNRMDPLEAMADEVGAQLATRLLQEQGVDAVYIPPVRMLRVREDEYGQAWVHPADYELTRTVLLSALAEHAVVLLAGFSGSTECGTIRTIGRSGSNTTSTLAALAVEADRVLTLTDVDGVRRAPPSIVPHAGRIDRMSLAELGELGAHTDGPVFQGQAVLPLIYAHRVLHRVIPLHIRSLADESLGTWAVPDYPPDPGKPVQGIGYQADLVAVRIDDPTIHNRFGVIASIAGILAGLGISVDDFPAREHQAMALLIPAAHLGGTTDQQEEMIDRVRHAILQKLPIAQLTADRVSMVSIVGEQLYRAEGIGLLERVGRVLACEGIGAGDPGGLRLGFSLTVSPEDGGRLVWALHNAFFPSSGESGLSAADADRVRSALERV